MLNTFGMYLKMMLAGQVLEQRPIQNESLYRGDFLQTMMREMIYVHEDKIETCDEQPQFILEEQPTRLSTERKAKLVLSKLGLFSKFFSWFLP